MGFAIELETSFLSDVDGTPVMGRCKVLSAADRLAYSSEHSRIQAESESGELQAVQTAELIALVDDWCARVLVECDATVGGCVYSKCDEETRAVYVAHLPMEAKSAVITAVLGLKSLDGGAEKN